ncbi:MAG: CCA tRNA nucleotidyltransferase [Clostridia bacterium]|nr:CCA tRNA nucleotidyltransferase [Clostridia bacterium]
MKIEMPESVVEIINTLKSSGYDAYVVGGCVRDSIMNRNPNDWDITTSAKPYEIKALFHKTIDVGIEHGTVSVVFGSTQYEVTTYRVDGEYIDNRHPDSVTFTAILDEDLVRRDFTINAMAYNDEDGIKDPFDGQKDIEAKVIRCVGDPNERFQEDALRMLRAIRFSAQLDFNIDPNTYKAIKNNSHLIKNISVERIRDEITKIIMSDSPEKFLMLYDTGLLKYIMPEFIPNINCPQNSPWHKYTVDEHIIRTVINIENRFDLRWTMLLHDIGKAKSRFRDEKGIDHFWHHPEEGAVLAEQILKRLNFDNFNANKIVRLIKYHDVNMSLEGSELRKMISVIGVDIFDDILKVMNADDSAKAEVVWIENREKNDAIKKAFEMFKNNKYCLTRRQLAITGDDLIYLGYEQGQTIGQTLEYLFNLVLEKPELNDEEELKEIARKHLIEIKKTEGVNPEEYEFQIIVHDEKEDNTPIMFKSKDESEMDNLKTREDEDW